MSDTEQNTSIEANIPMASTPADAVPEPFSVETICDLVGKNTPIDVSVPMASAPAGFPSFDSGISAEQDPRTTIYPAVYQKEIDLPTNVNFGEVGAQPPIPLFPPELNLHYQHLIEQGQETDLPSDEKPAEVKIPTEFRVTPEEVEKAIGSFHYSRISDFSTEKVIGAMGYIQLRNGYQTPAIPVISLPGALYDEDVDTIRLKAEATKLARDHIWMLLGYQAMSRLNNYEYKVPKLAPGEEITREFLDEHYVSEKNISGHLAIDHNSDQANPEIFNSYVRFPNARLAALVLKNGYTFFGIAQVVDIRNDVPSIGRSVAFEDAYRQLYQLAVYEQMEMAYQERLAAAQEASAS